MRRYALVLAAAIAVAILLGWVARRTPPESMRATSAPVPRVTLQLSLREDGSIAPVNSSIPKDHLIELRVRNATSARARLELAGYEDRVVIAELAPGDSQRISFLADRPGDDFAWLVDGRPAGRLQVLGSHLIEGHR